MAKIVKPIRFEQELIDKIQSIADVEHSGNYTAALESLAVQAIALRDIDERARWMMYSGSKRLGAFNNLDEREYMNLTKKMTKALDI
jgi:hypothetical protein